MSRNIIAYTAPKPPTPPQGLIQANFNHTEDFILMPDSKSKVLVSWTSRRAERRPILQFANPAHSPHVVSFFEHSPTMPGFLTCSEDNRARFWHFKNRTQNN